MVTFALFVGLFQLQPFIVQENVDRNREQVGEVLGMAVYRDKLSRSSDTPLINQLQILFAAPVLEEYKKTHLEEITPAESEISNAREYFDRKHEGRIKQGRPAFLKQLEVVEEELAQRVAFPTLALGMLALNNDLMPAPRRKTDGLKLVQRRCMASWMRLSFEYRSRFPTNAKEVSEGETSTERRVRGHSTLLTRSSGLVAEPTWGYSILLTSFSDLVRQPAKCCVPVSFPVSFPGGSRH